MNHVIRMTAPKIARRLDLVAPLVVRRTHSLDPLRFKALGWPLEPPPLDADLAGWETIPPRSYWGGQNVDFVLRGTFAVPADFDRRAPIALVLNLGDAGGFSHPEALVYVDGAPYATADRHHREVLLAPEHCDGAPHALALHGWTGLLGTTAPAPGRQLFMGECAVVQIDPPTRDLVALARVALQTANLLDDGEPARARLYNALDEAFRRLDTREPLGAAFYASVPAALETLRAGVAAAGPPLDVDLIAVGHAHIDVAWLWTLGQTRRKAQRTFTTVLRLMEQFPAFHFTQSQPQLYDFVRQDDPALFDAIKQRVAEGRWEPIGGMWVESDCNVTGAESLARQFLLGRAFFRKHFGAAESPVLWLPDVFGYAWCLPQLIKQAGLDYFFTVKIGWNQVNAFPYDSFWWQGLDGTRVLAHFSTAPGVLEGDGSAADLGNSATYNANLNAFAARGAWIKLKHKDTQRVLLASYGYGDGGGGPTREMNEAAQVLEAFPALPRVRQGKVIDFFRRLEAESGGALPVWNAELYLEIHRGTYTTQARNKRANRKSEFLLHDAEWLATLAALLDPAYAYPHATFRRAWERVCLNQFHDVIPGSSIRAVYEESLAQYAEVEALAAVARDAALDVVRARVGGDVLLVNPTGFRRTDLALWPGALPTGQRFAGPVVTQPVEGGVLVGGVELAPFSVWPLFIERGAPHAPDAARFPLHVTPTRLENAFVRVELDAAGDVVRIFDKAAGRDVLPPGAVANQFQAFEDRPLDWDAWDVDIFYDDKVFLAEPATACRVVEHGPLRATLEIERRILNSPYTQRISLAYNSPQIDVETEIDWRERHVLLKVAFPVDILAPVATHEVQWGSVERPTHRNTSWDWARFETCAHKWIDLSEGGYGVALLNDCKYGHDVRGNVMRMSLLRAPTDPDPQADQGLHRFAYSLYPHTNGAGARLAPSHVAHRAYALNDPLLAVDGRGGGGAPPAAMLELPPNAVVETVKWAEDGNGAIVRLYECDRQRGWVTLRTGFPLRAAWRCNVLEEDQAALDVEGSLVRFHLAPFQIVTLRLVPERETSRPL
ncbi:MAG: alpha-mannosidase [Anaerolineae bacterium]|nr:alpha-mannosidase [Anaerolineae bacterium]